MANEGHIIIKKSDDEKRATSGGRYAMSQFFKSIDKGSAKPAFCYPKKAEHLKEDLRTMDRNLELGRIDAERKMAYQLKRDQLKDRVDLINESFENAKAIIEKDPDAWKKRRENLAEEIRERTPTRDDVRKRRVNPFGNLRNEKVGDGEKRPLEQVKREYTIISRAFQARGDYEESNHSFLQKEK